MTNRTVADPGGEVPVKKRYHGAGLRDLQHPATSPRYRYHSDSRQHYSSIRSRENERKSTCQAGVCMRLTAKKLTGVLSCTGPDSDAPRKPSSGWQFDLRSPPKPRHTLRRRCTTAGSGSLAGPWAVGFSTQTLGIELETGLSYMGAVVEHLEKARACCQPGWGGDLE